MTKNERDTHFQGFAQLLYQELSTLEGSHETVLSEYRNKYDKRAIVQVIAQRAYDLVAYASEYINDKQLEEGMRLTPEYMLQVVPDLTKWADSPEPE